MKHFTEDIYIYSIPHTGTQFVHGFYKNHGTPIRFRHIGQQVYGGDKAIVIPVRNPYDVYGSWRVRGQDLSIFLPTWENFISETNCRHAFYFPLDIDHLHRGAMLADAIEFIGGNPKASFINRFADDWTPVGVGRKTVGREPPSDELVTKLAFAFDWYEHHTHHWGIPL